MRMPRCSGDARSKAGRYPRWPLTKIARRSAASIAGDHTGCRSWRFYNFSNFRNSCSQERAVSERLQLRRRHDIRVVPLYLRLAGTATSGLYAGRNRSTRA